MADLSIKNVPEQTVRRLCERANRNHRSLQDELLAIIEAAIHDDVPVSPADILKRVRELGLNTPNEATAIIREARDSR